MRRSIFLKLGTMFAVALVFPLLGAAQKQLAGEWTGTLNAGENTVPLAWHVTANADGSVTSTFDNQAEGVTGIKVKSLTLKDSALNIEVDDMVDANGSQIQLRGTLVGTVNKDATEVTGTWTQTEPEQQPPMTVSFKRVQAATPPAATSAAIPVAPSAPGAGQQTVAGDWKGVLMDQLHLVLHIKTAGDGTLSATLDSVDQNAPGIPVSTIGFKDGKLSLAVTAVQPNGSYDGTLSKDGNEFDGTWTQGQAMPLNFNRVAAETAQPSTAKKP